MTFTGDKLVLDVVGLAPPPVPPGHVRVLEELDQFSGRLTINDHNYTNQLRDTNDEYWNTWIRYISQSRDIAVGDGRKMRVHPVDFRIDQRDPVGIVMWIGKLSLVEGQ